MKRSWILAAVAGAGIVISVNVINTVRQLNAEVRASTPVVVTRAPTSSDVAMLVMFGDLDQPEPISPVKVTVNTSIVSGERGEYRSYSARRASAEVQSSVGLLPNMGVARQHFGLATYGDSVFASLEGPALMPMGINFNVGDEQLLVVLRDGTQIRGFTFSTRIDSRILNVRVVGVDFTSVDAVMALLRPHVAALTER